LIGNGVGNADEQPTAGNWQCVAIWNQAQTYSVLVLPYGKLSGDEQH